MLRPIDVDILGGCVSIATALHDTIEDETLPKHLRKIQLGNLLDLLKIIQDQIKNGEQNARQ
jgi:hypothetical protein